MRYRAVDAIISLALGAAFALPAGAQEILPFPPKPSGSIAGRPAQGGNESQRQGRRLRRGAGQRTAAVLCQ
jgi:hypothetical protein